MTRLCILVPLFLFFAAPLFPRDTTGTAPPKDGPAAPDTTAGDTVLPDSTAAAADTGQVKAAPDSAAASDSLRAGKKEIVDLRPQGKNGLGVSFTFMIPIVPELGTLRSKAENSFVADHMVQDAEKKFDDNDITWPLGIHYRRALNPVLELRAGAGFLWLENSNAWSVQEGDTVLTKPHVNRYALQVVGTALELQANISRSIAYVEKFNRFFVAVAGEFFPYIGFQTERTELGKNLDARGMGYGLCVYLGIEKYLGRTASVSGCLGYGLSTWGPFTDGSRVRASDVEAGGGGNAYTLSVRSLRFRFTYFRWW
jgi:hypothetical protein